MGSLDLSQEAAAWVDTEAYAKAIVDRFTALVNDDPELSAHRDFIDQFIWGFGERAFHWLWKLLIDEMPEDFSFLEVGVWKGQVLSLVRLLADRTERQASVTGVTLLSSFSGVTGKFPPFPDEDYAHYIHYIHHIRFEQEEPHLIVGDSTDDAIQQTVEALGPQDIVYIDGCHEYDYVMKDLLFYPGLVREGGFLVIDDSANYLKQPWGFFQGIDDVSNAVRAVIETDPQWVHLLAVMHNRVWRRVR